MDENLTIFLRKILAKISEGDIIIKTVNKYKNQVLFIHISHYFFNV
ncbi:hypothetical protein Thert_01655 [Thermoanaerobacterium thermosaccharolyticum]|uniref:Uncharacterized protein n=1 Tax=Thermoanaerobacterium thermosaccharolyticum TaxID=1517 RepID=A0A223HZD8_THETR|nr:hypothetical protein Thert_01655 [Thermoanaerobacterium thermosaccharolyticum]